MKSLATGWSMKEYIRKDLKDLIKDPQYIGYPYAYPHKTAYREFASPLSLSSLWKNEPLDHLFLYVHIPFCEFRCGYCNLFRICGMGPSLISQYLSSLLRQMESVRQCIPDVGFDQLAIGGGTPSLLSSDQLRLLFNSIEGTFNFDIRNTPSSFEISPSTADAPKLNILSEFGISRISVGIQSFNERILAVLQRKGNLQKIKEGLNLLRSYDFPAINIDLIYGIPSQTVEEFTESVLKAIFYNPDDIYLYPLYIRPKTALSVKFPEFCNKNIHFYRQAREILLDAGYTQISMRHFSKIKFSPSVRNTHCRYLCQEDGMIGLGCGARSYTRCIHYSYPYATSEQASESVIRDYIAERNVDFQSVEFGIILSQKEQQLRYIIKSLLRLPGISVKRYQDLFSADIHDFPKISALLGEQLIEEKEGFIRLTEMGLELSDIIGPWLYSEEIVLKMEEYSFI